ncbi:hypothetical protein BDW71DRAFT_190847, partial [Aspergillus fruticulosus]
MDHNDTEVQSPRVGGGSRDKGSDCHNAQPGRKTPPGASALASAVLVSPTVPEPERHDGRALSSELDGSMPSHSRLLLCNSRHKSKLFPAGHWIYNTGLVSIPATTIEAMQDLL